MRRNTPDLLFKINQLRNRIVKLIAVAKQEREAARTFANNLRDRVIVLETKADAAAIKLQDLEQRVTALEGG